MSWIVGHVQRQAGAWVFVSCVVGKQEPGAIAAIHLAAASLLRRTRSERLRYVRVVIALRACVDVDDLDRGIRFFTEGLGLRPGRRFSHQWAEMLGASAPIDLLFNRVGTAPVPGLPARRDYGRHWTPIHLDFVVDDLDVAVARAVAAGAVVERPSEEVPYGRIAHLADPFGHGLCLLQMIGRGYDALLAP